MNQGKIRICTFISNVSVLKCDSLEYCPVNNLKKYMEFCNENGFVLTGGYVFRPIDSYSNISDKPLTSSAVNEKKGVGG
jgi:hypothetical protein